MIVWYYFHVSLVWTTLKKRFIIHSFGAVCVYFGVCVCVCGLLLCRRTGVQYITTPLFSKVLVHVRRVQCVHGKSHQVKAQCDPFSFLIQKADRLDSSQCGQNISMTLIFCEVANMLRLTTVHIVRTERQLVIGQFTDVPGLEYCGAVGAWMLHRHRINWVTPAPALQCLFKLDGRSAHSNHQWCCYFWALCNVFY